MSRAKKTVKAAENAVMARDRLVFVEFMASQRNALVCLLHGLSEESCSHVSHDEWARAQLAKKAIVAARAVPNDDDLPSFEIGDLVTLRSGGPRMTVATTGSGEIDVTWFSGEELKTETFYELQLEPAAALPNGHSKENAMMAKKHHRKPAVGKYDKESSGIRFDQWDLASEDILEFENKCEEFFGGIGRRVSDIVTRAVAEGLKIAITEPCTARLKVDVSNDDPVSVVVELPLGPDDCSSPQWSFSLREVVKWEIECCVEGVREGDEEAIANGIWLAAVRDEFRKMADEIDRNLILPGES